MLHIEQYLEDHKEQAESELCQLLRIPSISAIAEHRGDMRQACDWLIEKFQSLGMKTEIL
jgi:acetylornithine deacetylase/succinyl-diaminopimelate desuccinylase-like protein